MPPWWKRFPDVLRDELEALNSAPCDYTVRENETTGEFSILLDYQYQGDSLSLIATYPAEYPFFPPFVTAPNLTLERHQHPVSKELCLLEDIGRDWSVHCTLASLLERQLPRTLSAAADPLSHATEEREAHQGEPWTDYPAYGSGSQILIPGLHVPADVASGKLVWAQQSSAPIRGVVLQIFDENKELLAEAEPWWQSRCEGLERRHGNWIRVQDNPLVDNAKRHFASVNPQYARKPISIGKNARARLAATIYPEESQWRERSDGWLISAHGNTDQRGASGFTYVRASRGSDDELLARIPDLRPLREKRILIAGLGMLGAPAALQFARAGIGHITVVDDDFVEFGTIVRWALGWGASGEFKTDAIASYIREQYPYVDVEPIRYRIGQPYDQQSEAKANKLEELLLSADLVFDACANDCVSNYVRYRCEELNIPHVWVSTTHGGWGGVIGRSIPGKTGCWSCMMRHQIDSGLEDPPDSAIPTPMQKKEDGIQPAGCRSPTATGAGIDTDLIVVQGARLAVGTLCRKHDDTYPDVDWDVTILALRDPINGNNALKSWTGKLLRHDECTHG